MGAMSSFLKAPLEVAAVMTLGAAVSGCVDTPIAQTPPATQIVYLQRHFQDDAGTTIVEHAECRGDAGLQACIDEHQAVGFIVATTPIVHQASHGEEELTRWMKNFRRRQ